MRTLSLILSVPLLLLPALHASAQSGTTPQIDDTPITSVQVTPTTRSVPLSDFDKEEVCGGYQMSNGWRMKLEPSYDGIVARIDRGRPIHLVALSPQRFVSRDGNVTMDFDLQSDDKQLRMTYVPADRTAGVIVVNATLAQR